MTKIFALMTLLAVADTGGKPSLGWRARRAAKPDCAER